MVGPSGSACPGDSCSTFSSLHLPNTIERLQALRHVPQEIRHVPKILSDAGIRLVIVQSLPGDKIDGACLWLTDGPVIAMTLRFDRIDHFWFVLCHELGHVQQGQPSLDVELEAPSEDRPAYEHEADAVAQEWLIPQEKLAGFIARIRPLYSPQRVEAFAHTMNVHPGIVVGQLQHRGGDFVFELPKVPDSGSGVDCIGCDHRGWGMVVSSDL